MKWMLHFGVLALWVGSMGAINAQNPTDATDPWEVRLVDRPGVPNDNAQRMYRQSLSWTSSAPHAAEWRVQSHEDRAIASRLYGPGQPMTSQNLEDRAVEALAWGLSADGWQQQVLGEVTIAHGSKHDRAFARQMLDGWPVLGSRFQAKFHGMNLVMIGADWWPSLAPVQGEWLDPSSIAEALEQDMAIGASASNSGTTYISDFSVEDQGMAWFPRDVQEGEVEIWKAYPVWQLEIQGRRGVIPVRYQTWVDMTTGEVLMRQNLVMHDAPRTAPRRMGHVPGVTQPVLPVFGQVKAPVHPAYPYDDAVSLGMPHLELPLGALSYFTDTAGTFNTSEAGDIVDVELALRGLFATVYTNDITPTVPVTFAEGYNSLQAPGNVKEASAYRSTNLIHDHMRSWLTEFSDLDFSMTVNIDVAGECNAFYNGNSINFYDELGGCNATSLIADVVYHEYGHAINDFFYQSLFYGFTNGAMNEGYADFWAMSLADIAEIGKGFYTENNDGIRRYDAEPKVYPEDIVGEVHADGEIICGAWYDTHLLLGGDWDDVMPLFVDAYPGLQATVPNGFEGQAYTDVLLDVLQADDDDDDLLNGTPNAQAIIEGFDLHGIRLFSYVDLEHQPVEFAAQESSVLIEAEANIVLPYSAYFDAMRLHYRMAPDAPWTEVSMDAVGDVYSHPIPGVPAGTVVEYFIDIVDVFGGISATTPVASDKSVNGNLPHYILVGVEPVLRNDLDDYSEFGYWDMDLPGDNATTGIWSEDIPVGSMADVNDPATVVAPLQDHTEGFFGYAYITGLSSELGAGIGANDVDGGHTTLLSPVMDLTPYDNPVISYWRWYANAPATGANPASDWWQVEITNDGGNTWQYLENTSQQDISWRRKAFRIADVIEPTASFQMRFIASDSTTIGEYLDGGSLVEAAVDDIILYDLASGDAVVEEQGPLVEIAPNPAKDQATLSGWMPASTVRFMDLNGREFWSHRMGGSGRCIMDVSPWPAGIYVAEGWNARSEKVRVKLEVLR